MNGCNERIKMSHKKWQWQKKTQQNKTKLHFTLKKFLKKFYNIERTKDKLLEADSHLEGNMVKLNKA